MSLARSASLAVLAFAALPLAASAQTVHLYDRAQRSPAGIAVPNASVAGAEEPTALQINPAGTGFVDDFTLLYFHEGRSGTGHAGDGFWASQGLGPVVPTLAMQWIRPVEGGGSRFRKTSLGLALAAGQTASFGLAWNAYASPQRDLDALSSLDIGLTLRPWRHLSLGLSALGMNGSLGGHRLPIRYAAGAGTRFLDDAVTLTADLLGTDRARDDLALDALALGAQVEIGHTGIAVGGQLQLPLESRLKCGGCGPQPATYALLTLAVHGAHVGLVAGGGGGEGADSSWLLGARLSSQRYRALAGRGSTVPVVDLARALSPSRSLFGGDRDPYGTLLRRLAEARDDAGVPALAIKIDSLPVGRGRIEELRATLLQVKAKKPVLAYLSGGGMKEYYLATAASSVLAPTATALFPSGLSSSTSFIKEGLDKLGVGFDVVAAGRFKNAPDPLVRTGMSEAQREATDRILDDVFGREVRAIALSRGLAEARVRELVDVGIFSAEEARAAGLIDGVAWPDELDAAASRLAGRSLHLAERLERAPERAAQRWGSRPVVAIIRVEGVIAGGESRSEPLAGGIAGAETLSRLIDRASSDRAVTAIVLRIDSPGGDGLASDLVWREVARARRKGKPVIASMGDVAASGGYLVAVAADAILAEPSTLTGSIGVFAVKPDLSGLLHKLGVNEVTLRRGLHADLTSLTRRWTADERALVEKQVLSFYGLFLSRVAEGRHMTMEAVDAVAAGQVWTGAQAMSRGLVDGMGSLEDAILLAKVRAGLAPDADVELRNVEPERSVLSRLTGGLAALSSSPVTDLAAAVPELRAAALLLQIGPVVALPMSSTGLHGGPDSAPRAP